MPFLSVNRFRIFILVLSGILLLAGSSALRAQSSNSGTITGTVKDPSSGAIQNAAVTIANPVSGYQRDTRTDSTGQFIFPNIPFNSYHLTVNAPGFTPFAQDVDVRSAVPLALDLSLKIGAATSTVTVSETAPDLLEVTSTDHTDVDRSLIDKLPLESPSSSVSSIVTLASPGVAADSNGLFHGLGDHAENSFSVDGQPITDQQSKVFSNQIPADSIQSLEVIPGAPPAEYGDKTSLIIKVTTRSGLGVKRPTGEVTSSFGSFQTGNVGFNLAMGGDKWGNFIAANGLTTNRFLDPPETTLMHDNGNQTNIFDRVDYRLSPNDTLSMNLNYTRSWFQTPNAFDNLNVGEVDRFGNLVGPTNQRSQIRTLNFAPTWTRLIGTNMVFELGGFARYDIFNYYPSNNPFADFVSGLSTDPVALTPVPLSIESETVSQRRTLLNTGFRTAVSYVKGRHNFKAGITYSATLLGENFNFGIVDPFFNPVCNNADGSVNTNPQITSQAQCGGPSNLGGSANPAFNPILGCYDLTRSSPTPLPPSDGCPAGQTISSQFNFNQHATINEVSPYAEDTITLGNFSFNLGFRYDFYRGLSNASLPEPRLGVAYKVGPSNTVLRFSYARTMETPFNENLILSTTGCSNAVLFFLLPGCNAGVSGIITPGRRNEFHAGFEQAFGKYFVVDGEYIWKFTSGAYDFSVFGTTPITFPIEWTQSKITGFTLRGSLPNFHGLSAFVVMSSVAARFFNPQIGGAGNVPPGPTTGSVFRIDHDEVFNMTAHGQYQPWKKGPWFSLNWRYDSGLVAGPVPFPDPANPTAPVDLTGLSADQQIQAGLFCGSQHPTLSAPLVSCAPSQYGSTLIRIPGTPGDPQPENDDHNPPRIAPRHLFDVAIGQDDLFHNSDRYKWSLRFTVINLTNKVALYNFLSTFSGTHYVTPRTLTGELGFHF